jgi:hypothetical protein
LPTADLEVARDVLSARLVVPLIMLAIVVGLATGGLTADRERPAAATAGSTTPTESAATPSESPTSDSGLTAAADKTDVNRNERVRISGQLTPAESGVQLQVERNMGDGWQSFPSSGTTKGDGSFSLTVRSGREGENVFRIVGPGDLVSNEVPVDVR